MMKKVKQNFKWLAFLAAVLFLLVSIVTTSHCTSPKGDSPSVSMATSSSSTEAKGEISSVATVRSFHSSKQFSCNVYVLQSVSGNILIDPGYYDEDIKGYIQEIGGLNAVLLTHGHWDHIYGLDALKADFPDLAVYIPEKDQDFLMNPELNGSSGNGFQLVVTSQVQPITEETLTIGSLEIDVISTPGHTRGSVMYYFRNEQILFSGDTIMKDQAGPTFRPTGSAEEMRKSVEKFRGLGYTDETPVYPGHGDSTTYGYILHQNKDVKE